MNTMISSEYVANVIQSFYLCNDGDEATTDLILAIGSELLDIPPDKMMELLMGNEKYMGTNPVYKFYMTIGDWSCDGHGRSEDFVVSSNMPVEYVRETHYKIKDKTGVDIESICSEYEEEKLTRRLLTSLKSMGFQFENSSGLGVESVSVREMAQLWIFLLQKVSPVLKLKIVEDDVPRLQFYGFDEQGRHISGVGYGLFS